MIGWRTMLCVALALSAFVVPAFAADGFIGDWATIVTIEGAEYTAEMNVTEEGGEVLVKVVTDFVGALETSDAKIDGEVLTFGLLIDALSPDPLKATLVLEDGVIAGTLATEYDEYEMTAAPAGVGIAGTWNVVADVAGSEYPVVLTVSGSDDDLTVVMEDDMNGTMEGTDVSFADGVLSFSIEMSAIGPDPFQVDLTIDGDKLKGSLEIDLELIIDGDGALDAGEVGEIILTGIKAGGIAGTWDVIAAVAGSEYPVALTISGSGDDLTVVMEDDMNGTMEGADASFADGVLAFSVEVSAIGPEPLKVELMIDGDTLEGALDAGDIGEIVLSGVKTDGV